MYRTPVVPQGVTPPLGAYSPAISLDVGDTRLVFVSGQIPLDPNGVLVSDDIEDQTRFVFDQIAAVLAAAGGTLDDLVKVQIYLTDIGEYPAVSAIRNEYLAASKPVSTLIEAPTLVHPGCRIEIDAVAAVAADVSA